MNAGARVLATLAATVALLAPPVEAAASRVCLITTGGTIAHAAPGRLSADDLLRTLPGGGPAGVRVETEPFANATSASLSLDDWARLARRVGEILSRDPEISGVVVTSGTDTLEELAFFLHLTISDVRPVVVVGAMRRPDSRGADGPRNLADALRVAAAPASRGRGTLVVMHGQVHAASDVRKRHATRLDAFDAPPGRVQGRVTASGVTYRDAAGPVPPPGLLSLGETTTLPRVDVFVTYQGAAGDLLEEAVSAGARGLVLAAAGAGSLTPSQVDAARRLAARGIPIVIATRTGAGAVPAPGPTEWGWLSAGALPPLKARLLLMLALATGADRARVSELFGRATTDR